MWSTSTFHLQKCCWYWGVPGLEALLHSSQVWQCLIPHLHQVLHPQKALGIQSHCHYWCCKPLVLGEFHCYKSIDWDDCFSLISLNQEQHGKFCWDILTEWAAESASHWRYQGLQWWNSGSNNNYHSRRLPSSVGWALWGWDLLILQHSGQVFGELPYCHGFEFVWK